MGEGIFTYSNGNTYKGSFHLGEKNGYGIFQSTGLEFYSGDWQMNLKEGFHFLK